MLSVAHHIASNTEHGLIYDICHTLKQSKPMRRCLGLLDNAAREFRVWSMPIGGCFGLGGTLTDSSWGSCVSLRTLLESTHPPRLLSRPDRLSIGIQVASSVIQLHHTLWLKESLSTKDIIFFEDPLSMIPLTSIPMVRHDPNPSLENHNPSQPRVVDKKMDVLFSLGVVLCELWFSKPLECICPSRPTNLSNNGTPQQAADSFQTFDSDIILLDAAHRALKALDIDAPKRYSEAVRTCLFGNIPEGQDFIATVWERVICPLEHNFVAFVEDPK